MRTGYLIKFMGAAFVIMTMVSLMAYGIGGTPNFISFFSGLERSEIIGDSIDLLPFMRWLWIYFPFWCIAGYYIDVGYYNRELTLARFGSRRRWYNRMYINLIYILVSYVIGFWLVLYAGGFYQVLLISVHAFFMISFFILIKELSNSGILSFLSIFIMEVFSYIIGEESNLKDSFLISSWGMYSRYKSKAAFVEVEIYKNIMIQLLVSCVLLGIVKSYRTSYGRIYD